MKYEDVQLWCEHEGKLTRHALTVSEPMGSGKRNRACTCMECPSGQGNERWPSNEALIAAGFEQLVGT
jgi:hypothetical protein